MLKLFPNWIKTLIIQEQKIKICTETELHDQITLVLENVDSLLEDNVKLTVLIREIKRNLKVTEVSARY